MDGGGSSKTVQTSEPPSYLKGNYQEIAKKAQRLYKTPGPAYYPGSTVAPLSPQQQAGISAQTQRGLLGSPLNAAAGNELTKTLNGDYLLAGNPYFEQMAGRVRDQVVPAVDSQFSLAGRYGSGAHTGELTKQLTDGIGALAYQNYGDERSRMQSGMTFAPTLAGEDWKDIAALSDAGTQLQKQGQSEIDADVDRYNYMTNLPWLKLGQYSDMITGQGGGTTMTSQKGGGASALEQLTGAGLGFAALKPWTW